MDNRIRRCSLCGRLGHDRRSCYKPQPLGKPIKINFDPWKHLEWEEHLRAMQVVRDHPSGMTLEEVGLEMGLTRERVRQIEADAFKKLRTGEGLGESIEYGDYAFGLVKCNVCQEYFLRDGSRTICESCEPDPIPINAPCLSLIKLRQGS